MTSMWNRPLNTHTKIVESLVAFISRPEFKAQHRRSKKDFTRDCPLSFVNIVFFLVNLVKGPLQVELDHFFKLLTGSVTAVRVVTKQAFSAARVKVRHTAFIEINRYLLLQIERLIQPRRWHGLDLRAIDGTTLRLPNSADIISRFGKPAKGGKYPLARAALLFDPLNNLIHKGVIGSYHVGERQLTKGLFAHLKPGDLVLLDRGFPALWLFAMLARRKIDWCARVTTTTGFTVVRDFLASNRNEQLVWLLPRGEPKLRVRLVRIELENGEIEVLMTSLVDMAEYPYDEFKHLYHLRWGQEENYKWIKVRAELENFSGKSRHAVVQEFYAKIFTCNLTAALALSAQEIADERHKNDRHPKKVNMSQALSNMKDAVVHLLRATNPADILKDLITLFAKTVEVVRPNRNYPRKKGPKLQGWPQAHSRCR